MADPAHNWTDEQLEKIEKKISVFYQKAAAEMQKTADDYFGLFVSQEATKRELLLDGKITEKEYKDWLKNRIATGEKYTNMKEDYAKQLFNVNQKAVDYLNSQMPDIYAYNYNALAPQVDGVIKGYAFDLVDASTIAYLSTTDDSLLPYKKLDPAKDIPWNMKKLNAEVLQGIQQGETMQKIADRFVKVQGMNEDAAIRSARTMVTSAECKGRQDSYEKAVEDGIIIKKEWMATNDNRTRHWHARLDGEEVDVDEAFVNEYGEIMYPGDPAAHPANVYNCRCTIISRVKGFKKVEKQTKQQSAVSYSKAEQEEFAELQKKYKTKEDALIFGTPEEINRYDYLLQKAKANIGEFDYYEQFKMQTISEGTLNNMRPMPTTLERNAISTYSGSTYKEMNDYLRFGTPARESVKEEISLLHDYLEKSVTDETIYLKRGINKRAVDIIFGDDSWRKNENTLIGAAFTDKGFVSTSPFDEGGFNGDVVMYIKAPKGTKGAYINDFAKFKDEKEFLLQNNTTFAVRNVVKETNRWGEANYKVYAEVVI